MAAKKKRKKPMTWQAQVLLLFAFILSIVFLPTTILIFFGMLPTMVASFIGRGREGSRALTVGAMNFAGCFPFILDLWTSRNTVEQAVSMLFDPRTIVVMYCAAAVGYLIDWAVSGLVGNILVQQAKSRIAAIDERQAAMVKRWGPEVTGEVALDEQGFPLDDDGLVGPKAKKS